MSPTNRLAAASDKVYQLLAQGRWFFPGTPVSSTTKTGRHDIAEILLKVALKHKSINQSINQLTDNETVRKFTGVTSGAITANSSRASEFPSCL